VAIRAGSGSFSDTNASHLVRNGDDCIIGGGANDSLRGDAGTDICIGGLGMDVFHPSCETQIQ